MRSPFDPSMNSACKRCVRFPLAVAVQRLRWRKPAQAVGGSPPAAFSASSRASSNSYIPVISSSAICRPMIRYCRVRGGAGHPPVSCPQERPRPCSSRGPRNRGFPLPPEGRPRANCTAMPRPTKRPGAEVRGQFAVDAGAACAQSRFSVDASYRRVRYFEKESRRRFRRELLTRDEAQRIAAIFA
jgi:hypothetical protein